MRKILFNLLGVSATRSVGKLSKDLGISTERLKYYNENDILPDTEDLEKICSYLSLTTIELKLALGVFDSHMIKSISENFKEIAKFLPNSHVRLTEPKLIPEFETKLGKLYRGDCLSLLKSMKSNSIDFIFADPPFNLDKFYASKMNDNLPMREYLDWSESWIDECVRVLKDGAAFFIWNLPKWNTYLSDYLNRRLSFKHWICSDIKFSLPIQGKLYPSHYSLLYYIKGSKPNVFKPDRLPMDVCKSCFKEIKDYGGYKNKMNPLGINLSDVWTDIPPVRHTKYKKRKEANELSIKLLDRVIEMATKPGDIVFDPFGGSGTTYVVAELKKRKWIGIELGPLDTIISRFETVQTEKEYLDKIRADYNTLFTSSAKSQRKKRKLWTDDTFKD